MAFNPAITIGAPVLAGGAVYALNAPASAMEREHEPLGHEVHRQDMGWTTGGGLGGWMLARGITPHLSPKYQILGTLGGIGAGAALGHFYGTPITARRSLKEHASKYGYPGGVDPATGLPVSVDTSNMAPISPEEVRRMHLWGI